MPLEGNAPNSAVKSSKLIPITKRTTGGTRLSSLFEDGVAAGGSVDAPFRARLHSLFAQIEKEFETLALENLNLQERLDIVSSTAQPPPPPTTISLHTSATISTATTPLASFHSTAADPTTSTAGGAHQPYHRYVAPEYFDTELVTAAAATSSTTTANKALKPKLSGSGGAPPKPDSSKVKASHKLRAQTSRIVSSFKGQSVCCSVVREFDGHKDGVWSVSVKSGQPIIGTASADHTAAIWSIESARCLLQYHGHFGSVNTIKFHPTKDVVLTASGDGTAHVWQAAVKWERETAGGAGHRVRGHSSEEELDDEEDPMDEERGDRVDVLRTPLAEMGTGQGGHVGVVIAADWLPGGDQIITASWDRTAILWDVETREPLQPLAGHDDELTFAAAHPTQRLVVTSSRDSTFRLWDFRDQIPAVSVFQGHTDSVTSTVFTRDDRVVSGSDDRTVKVWELRNMRSALATIRTDASINKLAVSQSGVIAIPHDNRHIRLFDLNGQRVARLPRSNRLGHQRMASSVAWADDPTYSCSLFSAGFDRRVLGWTISLPKENQQ